MLDVEESKRVVEVEERERAKTWSREVVREVVRRQKREEYGLEVLFGNDLHDSMLFWDFGESKMRGVDWI